MNAKKTTIIILLQWSMIVCAGAGEMPDASLVDLANKAFAEKEVLRSSIPTSRIEASIKALADTSLEKLKSGNVDQKKVAARILGILRERRAIPLLIDNIGLEEMAIISSGPKYWLNVATDYPACAALKNIGGPEVVAAVRKLVESNTLDNRTRKVAAALLQELQ